MTIVTSGTGSPQVSVIVPSYNSRRTIDRCLRVLLDQDGDFLYEIVLVDSSDDGTGDLVSERYPSVQLIRLAGKTLPGKARNLGARHARGSILAFTDADCVASKNWLRRHLERHTDWDVVGGAMGNGTPKSLVGWASYLSEFSEFTPGKRFLVAKNLVSANVSYVARVFETEQFPEDIFPGEDTLLHKRLATRFRCCLDASIVIDHLNRTEWSAFLAHQQRLGTSAAEARRRAPLPGAVLVRHPWMAWATPGYRMQGLARRLIRQTPRMLPWFLLVSPMILVGACWWARAFVSVAKRAGQSDERINSATTSDEPSPGDRAV